MKAHQLANVFGTTTNKIGTIYIINLDRQIKRWKQYKIEANSQRLNGNKTLFDYSHRISAIDAKELDESTIDTVQISKSYNLSDQYYVDPDPRFLSLIKEKDITINLTKEEIAVALSHIKIWEKIVFEKLSYVLVLEDDIFFENDFDSKLNQIWRELPKNSNNKPKFDLLYLSFWEVDHGVKKEYFSKNIFRPIRGLIWLSGYVLSYSGAKMLLNELPVYGPVDVWINHMFKKLQVFASRISIINQRENMKSDNNYSILPILSHLNTQSDKNH